MSWRYKDPKTFPAYFAETMRKAAASPHEPQLFQSSTTSDLSDLIDLFRRFRWCIRQRPENDRTLSRLELTLDFRLSRDTAPGGTLLYLTARPTKVSELLDLNPELANLQI